MYWLAQSGAALQLLRGPRRIVGSSSGSSASSAASSDALRRRRPRRCRHRWCRSEIGIGRRGDDDDIAGARLRRRDRDTVVVVCSSIARSSSPLPPPPRAPNSGTASTAARTTAPTLSTRGSTAPSGPSRRAIGGAGSSHIDEPSSSWSSGSSRRTTWWVRVRSADRADGPARSARCGRDRIGRPVPEAVVVVEVVAHGDCRRALAGRRQGTGLARVVIRSQHWRRNGNVRHVSRHRRTTPAPAIAARWSAADTIVPTLGEVAESGRTRLPAKEVTAARWSVGSNPTLSAQPHGCGSADRCGTRCVGRQIERNADDTAISASDRDHDVCHDHRPVPTGSSRRRSPTRRSRARPSS